MKGHVVSLYALLIAFAFINNTAAAMVSVERSETVQYTAVVGKAFAVDLRTKIKAVGIYSFVNTSSWLQLSEEGILFGTPAEANLGDHKLFVSIKKGKVETLVRVLVHVDEANTTPTLAFSAKVGEIFKTDLVTHTLAKGTYTYTNLPVWLEGLENGVLIGMPEKADVGTHTFEFSIKGLEEMNTKVTLEVKAEPITPPVGDAFLARVGEFASVNLYSMALEKSGDYILVHSPKWMTLDSKGWLSGTPTEADRGEDYVTFHVVSPKSAVAYTFKTRVL